MALRKDFLFCSWISLTLSGISFWKWSLTLQYVRSCLFFPHLLMNVLSAKWSLSAWYCWTFTPCLAENFSKVIFAWMVSPEVRVISKWMYRSCEKWSTRMVAPLSCWLVSLPLSWAMKDLLDGHELVSRDTITKTLSFPNRVGCAFGHPWLFGHCSKHAAVNLDSGALARDFGISPSST